MGPRLVKLAREGAMFFLLALGALGLMVSSAKALTTANDTEVASARFAVTTVLND